MAVSLKGITAGGIADGFIQGEQLHQNKLAQGLEQRKFESDQKSQVQQQVSKAADDLIKSYADLRSNEMVKAGAARDPGSAAQIKQSIKNSLQGLLERAVESGVYSQGLAQSKLYMLDALDTAPSMQETAIAEGGAEAAKYAAQTPAVLSREAGSRALGREQDMMDIQAGVRAAPERAGPKFQTEAGKQLADLDLAKASYGEDSQQFKYLAKATQGAGVENKDKASLENQYRDEYAKQSSSFITQQSALDRILASQDTPQGDMNLIFGFMKILDPGSTVREGEAATAENAQGVDERIASLYNRTIKGERLAPEARVKFKQQAIELLRPALADQKQRKQQYGEIAKRNGADPEDVTIDFTSDTVKKALAQPVSGKEDYDAVESGEYYIDPAGNVRKKP